MDSTRLHYNIGKLLAVTGIMVMASGSCLWAQETTSQPAQPSSPQQQQPQQQQQGQAGQPAQQGQEVKKELTAAPVLEIRRLEAERPVYSIELRDVLLTDLFRVIAHDYNLNILMDQTIDGKITASFTNISLEEALEAIAEMANLAIEKKGTILRVNPNLVTKTFIIKHIEAKKLYDSSVASTGTGQAATPTSGLYTLLSTRGKILLVQQQNALTVVDYPENVRRVAEYLESVDHKLDMRVFKLKYLKADEVVGVTTKSTTTTQTISPTGTQVQTTTSATTASGGQAAQ